MQMEQGKIEGCWKITPQTFHDTRGYFSSLFNPPDFQKHGLCSSFTRLNTSFNRKKGTLRGLHYQNRPYQEIKLVKVTQGSIWDVILDIRQDSPTFGCYQGFELSASNRHMMYVPAGCAHGFLTLTPKTEVLYLTSNEYQPKYEAGIRWNDPSFNISWPATPTCLSEKDRCLPDFKDSCHERQA